MTASTGAAHASVYSTPSRRDRRDAGGRRRREPGHGRAGRRGYGVPRFDHVVLVMFENHTASSIYGSSQAPYINSLANNGAKFTQSFALDGVWIKRGGFVVIGTSPQPCPTRCRMCAQTAQAFSLRDSDSAGSEGRMRCVTRRPLKAVARVQLSGTSEPGAPSRSRSIGSRSRSPG
jgi:hypothetical protein